jgi:hypothetical protein
MAGAKQLPMQADRERALSSQGMVNIYKNKSQQLALSSSFRESVSLWYTVGGPGSVAWQTACNSVSDEQQGKMRFAVWAFVLDR